MAPRLRGPATRAYPRAAVREVPGWLGLGVAIAALLAGCGEIAATPSTTTTVRATPSASPTPTPTPTPTATPAASGPQLDITQFGVSMNLTADLGWVSYVINNVGEASADANGNPVTLAFNVIIWPNSLASDPACSAVAEQGLVDVSVFTGTGNPTGPFAGSGLTDFKQIGQYWFAVTPAPATVCGDGNPQEQPLQASLIQAYQSLHPDAS